MHYCGVTYADKGQQGIEFWALAIFVQCLVGKYYVHLNLFKLTVRVLVKNAVLGVTDTLTFQSASDAENVRIGYASIKKFSGKK